jgi:AAA+ ATPase superfamily predicted ATPase
MNSTWGFYGRDDELAQLRRIVARGRWFFARITGRRRIGKTTLLQRGLGGIPDVRTFYVQIPDSAPAGVLAAVHDAMATFELPPEFPRPTNLLDLARLVEKLARAGWVVVLDEFQYFSRKALSEFPSHLQTSVDRLSADAANVRGGLVVLGSLHAEIVALLDDRTAPLYNRTTDVMDLRHLDLRSLQALLHAHGADTPEQLLFLWNLFEGVPKFYRDAWERGVLAEDRATVLKAMFFESSAPLRTEAENWFLSELRGRYDVVLKYVASHPGCNNGDIEAHLRDVSPDTAEQAGGYLRILIERYAMLERRLPILARPNARRGRYHVRDNFLRSWLNALASPVAAVNFRPLEALVSQADSRLMDAEGHALERLAGTLYEERSRRGLGDFALTRRVEGFWDRSDVELDLVAISDEDKVVRFGSCKRNAARLLPSVAPLKANAARFLGHHRALAGYRLEYVAIAPRIEAPLREALASEGVRAEDLRDLTRWETPS